MTSNPAQDDREARKLALEKIAANRQKMLREEAERRAKKKEQEAGLLGRQQEAVLADAGQQEERLEARNEFITGTREKRRAMEEERKKKLAEERRLLEEKKKKEAEEEERKEYMGELHDKAIRKKIENRREIIAHEEETSLRGIADHQGTEERTIAAEEEQRVEHLEREFKQAAAKAVIERDRKKSMAEEKRKVALEQLKHDTFELENRLRRSPAKDQQVALQKARQDGAMQKQHIEQEYKASCRTADEQWQAEEHDRAMELQKLLTEAHRLAAQNRLKAEKQADERRNEARVRRVGEEQWLLGKDG